MNDNKSTEQVNIDWGLALKIAKAQEVVEDMQERFTSGNSVPVERATIGANEWTELLQFYEGTLVEIERLQKIEAAARLYHAGWSDPGSCLDGWLTLCASLSASPSPVNANRRAAARNGEDCAYPCEGPNTTAYGLTKREQFAMAAMQAILSGAVTRGCPSNEWIDQHMAVRCADELLKELAK